MTALKSEDLEIWRSAEKGWRAERLSAEGDRNEFVVSAVDAQLPSPLSAHLPADRAQLHLLLNLDGALEVACGDASQRVLPKTVTAIGVPEGEPLRMHHEAGPRRFVSLRFCSGYLRSLLASDGANMRPGLEKAISGRRLAGERPFSINEPMQATDRGVAESMIKPPIAAVASGLWFRAKAIELLSTWCFRGAADGEATGAFFCSQQKRTVLERVARAKAYLADHLDEPLELAAVAKAAGSSPHYLSRQFSAETGMTLSRYLRALRVERAGQLLAAGEANVTEAAMEVGYQSLSHFARAFQEEKGQTPSEYIERLTRGHGARA